MVRRIPGFANRGFRATRHVAMSDSSVGFPGWRGCIGNGASPFLQGDVELPQAVDPVSFPVIVEDETGL